MSGKSNNKSTRERKETVSPYVFAAFTGDRSGSMRGIHNESGIGLFEWATDLIESANEKNQQGRMFITCFDNVSERRLDNVVFRFGISNTRSGARQFVSHRHITVNGEVLNIPSYMVKEGDVIGVREKSKSNPVITASLSSNNRSSDWLEWDSIKMSGRFIKVPERVQIPENIKEQLIVELYSK